MCDTCKDGFELKYVDGYFNCVPFSCASNEVNKILYHFMGVDKKCVAACDDGM
jgi:hypothetical protein